MEPNDAMDTCYQPEQGDSAIINDLLQMLGNNEIPATENQTIADTRPVASPGSMSSSSASSSPTYTSLSQRSPQPNVIEGNPYIRIVEQPHPKGLRFRYICEGRSAGSIPGINSTPDNKTYPTIEIVGYTGNVKIIVSCVTADEPYRPHPHNLVGKEGCDRGVCTMRLKGPPMRAVFSNLGIQCVKKKEIKSSLEERERINVDPFKTKFAHMDQPSSIDLNIVRLCFQAFIPVGSQKYYKLKPVVTEPIYDKKSINELVICRLCSCSAKASGGDTIFLLCEKLPKDDIKIRFYEEKDGKVIWEDYGEFQQTDIHKQTAIAFKTPRYHNTEIEKRAQVFIQLVRFSSEPVANGQTPTFSQVSDPLHFEFYPDPDQFKRKRLRTGGNPMRILQEIQQYDKMHNNNSNSNISINTTWNIPPASLSPASTQGTVPEIKNEPFLSPNYCGTYRTPYQMSPSPQPASPMNRNSMTPSPGLMKTPSADSQTQMCNSYNQIQINGNTNYAPSNANNNDNNNPFLNGNKDFSNINQLNTLSTSPSTNPFYNPTSGGSITPLYPNANNNGNLCTTSQFPNLANITTLPNNISTSSSSAVSNLNIVGNHQFHYQYQDFQQQTHVQQSPQINDTNDAVVSLNTLLQIDSDNFVNINSEELRLSNLSIST
ncbi:dorsal-related immunity factor Dif [Musca domestica]|uniref:Dorsal-related immunity factor Dif n=2 Tax=Musca domestica TaxID=7370 RepID=A0A9J7DFD8_MUSDO|nr:dorsal-related immunity factor Dif [Musca domestica]XP_058986973.1 dorsal-related immunity factor Dif [Musca domestica]